MGAVGVLVAVGEPDMKNKLYVTKSAHEKLLEIVESKKKELNEDTLYVRVLFTGRTNISLSNTRHNDDTLETHAYEGVPELKVVYNADIATFLEHATIDYVEDELSAGFSIDNPNDIQNSCESCGGGAGCCG
ncbi:hypothetical protein COT72_05310 [archaeon CG10_big_fil_rev_8_21_14_0_10_43_11]|nr:MAG: hypothetical protein COT72_05310 [archaeon CG10_big_fil_rev_8_21_14_0_10_43_11]